MESLGLRYSFIIPVYNRPDELGELLDSFIPQEGSPFEIIVVEDGSTLSSAPAVEARQQSLKRLRYISIPNGGPAHARNVGATIAQGDYIVVLDSDTVLPPSYLQALDKALEDTTIDAFGGPDAAAPSFTSIQQAINYAMTSPLTTGGIRGAKPSGMEHFKPRSFNMGCRRSLYDQLGGFDTSMRFGEDIDFSLRLEEAGAKVVLIPKAYVYHKRRLDLRKFFRQVHNSGIARIHIENRHPGSTRLVHLLPAAFTVTTALSIFIPWLGYGLVLLAIILWLDAYKRIHSFNTGALAVIASFVQLWGYGSGYLRAWFGKYILRQPEFTSFRKNFYD